MKAQRRIVNRVCPFCEATCGVAIEVEGDQIVAVRGDKEDPFSRGFICPKAYGLKAFQQDPDRLKQPMRRTAGGWQPITWEAAFAEIETRLTAIQQKYGRDAVGMYSGNPIVHDLALMYMPVLARALGSKSLFNASAVDTLPKQVQTGLMFGGPFPATIPVPDIDRTSYLLIVGANPAISHGSLMTMPDAPGRLKGVVERGGKLVVIDPRRTETARLASEHHFIRPGADAAFLLAMVHTLFDENLVRLGAAEDLINGLEEVKVSVRAFAPEAVAGFCGMDAATIRRLAREFAAAPSAACYGRLGTCVQEFGTLSCWGIELMNILAGNLDRPGGVMFTTPAAPINSLSRSKPFTFARFRSRVSGQPEVEGRIPSSTMAEEMLTPGDGQVRAMILLMTNPLRSAANSEQLERAFKGLEFVVAVDFYINETTRYADIILPTPTNAEASCYEFGLYHLSVRNVAKWSSMAVPPKAGSPSTWEVILRLGAIAMGIGKQSTRAIDDVVFSQIAGTSVGCNSKWENLTTEEVIANLKDLIGPERLVDMLVRIGPYGDGFGRRPDGLTLAKIKESEHGIDLGPLEPRLRELLNTRSGKIELAPREMLDDLPRLRAHMTTGRDGMILIGRRDLRWSNSFMHNLPALVKGRDRCVLQISPSDAGRFGLGEGDSARITSRVGSVVAPIEITTDLMPGVVSLPHGWGHDAEGSQLQVAKAHAGVNTNVLTDDRAYDVLSGTAVLFGTPVRIEPELGSGK
ncbi:MAG TPA: molybdopterin-dependent oxidoreductase [Candidatus Binataceae bacterium]|nr:molybdopterin-dependent oxidoreductase [Candidatus Binataceae bacterium]